MMMRRLSIAFACLGLFVVCACQHDDDSQQRPVFHPTKKPNASPTPTTSIPEDQPDMTPPPPKPPKPTQESAGGNPPPAPTQGDYPYGVPVPSKPGYVTSPYAPDSGYVDVHGFTTGQEVRDPYTGKIFLVP